LSKDQIVKIDHDRENLFDMQDNCSNSKDTIIGLQNQIMVEQSIVERKEKQIIEIKKKNKVIIGKIKNLEKKINDIVKEKDLDLGKQRKILSELEEAKRREVALKETISNLENQKEKFQQDIFLEEEKTKAIEKDLKKKFEEMNLRNNSVANELQILRRNLANLHEQLD